MIKNREDLVNAITSDDIEFDVNDIWDGNVNSYITYTCEPPLSTFNAFLAAPEMFPFPSELLILWETNATTIIGYLREQKKYIRYCIEDGPEDYDVIGDTYQQMLGVLMAKLVSRSVPKDDLVEISNFFHFKYLDDICKYVKTNSDWEDNICKFICSREML